MKDDFDFKSIGKRMPYEVPEGFFDILEANVLEIVGKDKASNGTAAHRDTLSRPQARKRTLIYSLLSAAAVITLLLVVGLGHTRQEAPTLNDVDKAFSQLSTDDQQYMLNVYQEDAFLNYLKTE